MRNETEQAELVEFEIVRDSGETPRSPALAARVISPWQVARFVLLGLGGVALFFVVLGAGLMLAIPVLVFIAFARLMRSIFPSSSQGR